MNNMISCELCPKSFKTSQGLLGHLRFKHGTNPANPSPTSPNVQQPDILKFDDVRTLVKRQVEESLGDLSVCDCEDRLQELEAKIKALQEASKPKAKLTEEDLIGQQQVKDDDYICGECGAVLPDFVDVCPNCKSELEWDDK